MVFLSIIFVNTPPRVSIPRERGVTSIRIISAAELPATSSPPIFPPCIAAPSATHSSGFKLCDGSFPVSTLTSSTTAGTRVEPPTSSTIPRSSADMPASFNASFTGTAVLFTRSLVSSLNLALVRFISMCLGSPFTVVINGRFIITDEEDDKTFFAFSASSRTLCIAVRSFVRSMCSALLNSLTRYAVIRSSKSSPPRLLSPAVARTSIRLSPISIIDTSNVPPPRSYTNIFCGCP